ncbi:hypothetical protein [Roseovarius ramblicola]|uniref:PepSY domain-containing protein n=1 Tax=Roseovarius ramblicola TaxID=2022336 RepID=A0ABV5I275_9RHOB
MPRRLILFPVLILAAAVMVLGLVLGGRAATTTETEVIDRVAARYARETGSARDDCAARPAVSAELWLVVTCAEYEYFVDAFGRVVDVAQPGKTS